ncbi:error-prone DNA polymerase [Pseudoalteromonas sp. MMG024]|uniref:error-prone DNA polymerase n=1 Tax=Pseudoalteromonas sp. MMG024 TaxID=2909980 RepID=UPI001EFFB742|nr:error-prone DNA polymerase [Pseudoalteromonas sp. MMG024]MCF6457986.1 error-prone DNA polymerase [Pseudoalteromonas sp. MMG024]
MNYAELVCQSNFSFLHGASHPEELVATADNLGYSHISITDECSVAGVVRAHREIKNHQRAIKLIVGSLFTLEGSLTVVLLCPTRKAYAELCRIITNARRRSEKGNYLLTRWDLMSIKHCLFIWLPKGENIDHHWANWLKKHHEDRLWLGLTRFLLAHESEYMEHCQRLITQYDITPVACGYALMHQANRLPLQHVLSAIKARKTVAQLGQKLLSNEEYALREKQKLSRLFSPDALAQTTAIANRCHFNLDELRYEYPSELVPKGVSAMAYLRQLVKQGIAYRFPEGITADIQATIDKELALIEELDYPFYFLTIHDIVMFAKKNGILYQGRGSAANSVVCYCLEITAVDPRQIAVLFERFISKERNEPPDIDVDFEHQRREEVIQYIYQKYGRERTALAATVVSFRFKSAIREVGKALDIEGSKLEYFIKNINRRDKTTHWQTQLQQLGLDPQSNKAQHFVLLTEQILGFPRHLSQHVGGFVISSGPLYELVAVENAAMKERTVIQWDKDDLETLGLLKVDILALGMLNAIRKCFQEIKMRHQRQLSIADITRVSDDAAVYQMIQKADTVGVFQIESRAQMSMLPRLKPTSYYDLVIQIAIVRPGPIQGDMVHPFLKRRNGIEAISYPSNEVKEVLARTLGVPIFQEQVIKIAMVAAGFTGGEADQLRRAMARWKKSGELQKFKQKLINGMLSRGYQMQFAERLYQQICGFGEYGFPESHSASFAVLAYVSAWLKHYYPVEFYTSLLNSMPLGFYSVSQLLQDAKRHNIEIAPVCVNHSYYQHTITKKGVLQIGFCIIKGVTASDIEQLINQRPKTGYESIEQLKQLGIKARLLAQLASANALSVLAGNRFATRWQIMNSESDLPLFNGFNTNQATEQKPAVPFHQAPSESDNVVEDYQSTGFSLGLHPIDLLEAKGVLPSFCKANELTGKTHKSLVTVIGVVTGKQAPGTAAGVTFITLEDATGNINVVVWQGTSYAQKKAFLGAKVLQVKGILEREGDVIHIIAGKLIDLTDKLDKLAAKSREFH